MVAIFLIFPIYPGCFFIPNIHPQHPSHPSQVIVTCASCWVKASVVSQPKDFMSSLQFTAWWRFQRFQRFHQRSRGRKVIFVENGLGWFNDFDSGIWNCWDELSYWNNQPHTERVRNKKLGCHIYIEYLDVRRHGSCLDQRSSGSVGYKLRLYVPFRCRWNNPLILTI